MGEEEEGVEGGGRSPDFRPPFPCWEICPKLQGTAPTSGPRRREVGALNASDQTHCPRQCVSLWDVPVPRALFCLGLPCTDPPGPSSGPRLVGSSLRTTPVSRCSARRSSPSPLRTLRVQSGACKEGELGRPRGRAASSARINPACRLGVHEVGRPSAQYSPGRRDRRS